MTNLNNSKPCCTVKNIDQLRSKTKVACSNCNNMGKKVDIITIKALVKEGEILNIKNDTTYYYCATKNCNVVYYNTQSSYTFNTEQIKTIVGDKNPLGYICYCFGFKTNDLKDNLETEFFIREKIKEGCCACEVKNIHGSCCLGDVLKVLKDS